jgi:hypothetical protein
VTADKVGGSEKLQAIDVPMWFLKVSEPGPVGGTTGSKAEAREPEGVPSEEGGLLEMDGRW